MAQFKYTVSEADPISLVEYEKYSTLDTQLIDNFEINSEFSPTEHYIEAHYYSLSDSYLTTTRFYRNYKQILDNSSAGKFGTNSITVDPVEDIISNGYEKQGAKVLYVFLNDLFAQGKDLATEFYIDSISYDRTEIKATSLSITDAVTKQVVDTLQQRFNRSYFEDIKLNFGKNDYIIVTNIDAYVDSTTGDLNVYFKLYEPLPSQYVDKTTFSVVEFIGIPSLFEVESEEIIPQSPPFRIAGPNFTIDLDETITTPSEYFTYQDLFDYPLTSSYQEIYSKIKEKGAYLGTDFTNYSEFVHFSSAEERLRNFYYKIQLLDSHNNNKSILLLNSNKTVTTSSIQYYESQSIGILQSFDPYERFLYYESSSYTWPKSTRIKPYINYPATSSQVNNWLSGSLMSASFYDTQNKDVLTNAIPTYILEDSDNQNFITFVNMIGQHFDSIWTYTKALSKKYDADNRLDKGVSRDLVGDILKSFGINIPTTNQTISSLFNVFTGISNTTDRTLVRVPTGSAIIHKTISGSNVGNYTGIASSTTSILGTGFGHYRGQVLGTGSVATPSNFLQLNGAAFGTFVGTASGTAYDGIGNVINTGVISGSYTGRVVGRLTGSISDGFIGSGYASYTGSLIGAYTGSISGSFSGKITGPFTYSEVRINPIIQPVSMKDYEHQIQKRIYHNLPLLLKAKGTERAVRTLLNCYGIPSGSLPIYYFGGVSKSENNNYVFDTKTK